MEETMNVYWTSVEFDILTPAAYEDCIGGYVYLFLKARDVMDAIPKIQKAIEQEDLRIHQVEFVSLYDEMSWESKEDRAQYDALAEDARKGDEVVWDEISAYESRDD